jgi:hypothetical protein
MAAPAPAVAEQILSIRLTRIELSITNPRKSLDPKALADLAADIKKARRSGTHFGSAHSRIARQVRTVLRRASLSSRAPRKGRTVYQKLVSRATICHEMRGEIDNRLAFVFNIWVRLAV